MKRSRRSTSPRQTPPSRYRSGFLPRSRVLLRTGVLSGVGLLIVLAVVAATSFVRVPEGSVAAIGGALREPGWRLRRPFARVPFIPLAGRLEGVEVERRTEEGASLRIRLSFAYELEPGQLAEQAAGPAASAGVIESSGLRGLVARLAETALEPMPLAALLPAPSGGPVADAVGSARASLAAANAPLPRPATETIARALRSGGIELLGLDGADRLASWRASARRRPLPATPRRPGPRAPACASCFSASTAPTGTRSIRCCAPAASRTWRA